ncbi:putative ribonuclease H protein [Glycine soja]
MGMSPPRIEAGLDTIAWNGTADGSFNWKSAYGVVCDLQVTYDINLFKLVHRWLGPKRIRMFLWKISHESILTNAKRMRIGISVNDECFACQGEAEALLHLFRDCNDCKQIGLLKLSKLLHSNTTSKKLSRNCPKIPHFLQNKKETPSQQHHQQEIVQTPFL